MYYRKKNIETFIGKILKKSAIKLEYKYIKSDGFSKCDQSFEVRKVKLGKPQHALLVLNTENHTC